MSYYSLESKSSQNSKDFSGKLGSEQRFQEEKDSDKQRGWGGNFSGGNRVAKMQKSELLVCSWGLQSGGMGRHQTQFSPGGRIQPITQKLFGFSEIQLPHMWTGCLPVLSASQESWDNQMKQLYGVWKPFVNYKAIRLGNSKMKNDQQYSQRNRREGKC